jgi:hypothetical protein
LHRVPLNKSDARGGAAPPPAASAGVSVNQQTREFMPVHQDTSPKSLGDITPLSNQGPGPQEVVPVKRIRRWSSTARPQRRSSPVLTCAGPRSANNVEAASLPSAARSSGSLCLTRSPEREESL